MKFNESALAHKYCIGYGIEIGAAAHNPFGLINCFNVGIKDDEEFYKKHQIDMCGEFAKIDIYARADKLSFLENNSINYIVSSHVIEHLQDLIGTFLEWHRVIKNQGIVFIIFPKRDALEEDKGRPLSSISDFVSAHQNIDIIPFDSTKHVWVFDLQLMKNLIDYCCNYYCLNWTVIELVETDDKCGNGHMVVCRVNK